MGKNLLKTLLILALCIGFVSTTYGQRLTGSVRGVITDSEGNALPGVTVTATSEALMGAQTYITTDTGSYRFPALPPGWYAVSAEMPGFKTTTRSEIEVRVGMTITINITMEMTTIEEEVTVTAASPVVDVEQTKLAVVMDKELLKNIPMARDLYDIVNSAPGAISENQTYRRTSSIHGGTVRSNTYAFDGVNMNDPVVMYPLTNINFDVMDEVEMVTAGHPAETGYTTGAYINVVTRSGGNRFSGGGIIYYTTEGMSESLWTDEQVQALGVSQPGTDKMWFDGSATLGGPIIQDRLWFFTNGRYIKQEQSVSYVPWTDILGYNHQAYDWIHEEYMGFIKLTAQATSNIKLMGMFNYVNRARPMYEEPGPRTNFIATRKWDGENDYTGTGVLSYILDQNTFFDLRVGYVSRWFPIPMQDEAQNLPYITDYADNYDGLTTARFNETYLRKRFQAGIYFTRFQDATLGGNHEFKGGIEFENAYGDWDWWRKDNLLWYWYGEPYYYGGGTGLIYFYTCGPDEGSSKIIDKARRIGAYLQDSVTFADKLTLNIGIRYDRSWGWKPAVDKSASGNPLSVWLGETYIRPMVQADDPERFPNGLNPWGAATSEDWNDIITWNSISPRLGLTYDVFGDGKTAIKLSFARYNEYLMLQFFSTLHPFYPRSYGFYWYDTDLDGVIEQSDDFDALPSDFRGFDPEFAKQRLDPDLTAPLVDEFTIGVWQEVFKNFSLGVNFIYKEWKNIVEDAMYAPDTDEWWYHIDQAPTKNYYVPFRTTVPAVADNFEDVDLTFYVRLNPPDAPASFYRLTNVEELTRKYWALEFLFNKRMSEGWQFSGSIVYSKSYGNLGGWYGESWGWSGGADNPNWFINQEGRLGIDRPLQIKLMGTARLPYRIFLSAIYAYLSGSPWTRDIQIRPPSSWTTPLNAYRTYYSVLLEPQGTRRNRSWNMLDLRLEKEFRLGEFGTIGAFVDVLNVLGWSSVTVGQDDVYRWQPTAEGFGQSGSMSTESSYQYISQVSGRRTVKLSLRLSF